MNVEVAVLGSRPSLIVLTAVSVAVKQHRTDELGSCVRVEVAVLGSPSLTVLIAVSVAVKQH